jgi:hypothetical protein
LDQNIVQGLPKKFTKTIAVLLKRQIESSSSSSESESDNDPTDSDTISEVTPNGICQKHNDTTDQNNKEAYELRIKDLTTENHKLHLEISHMKEDKQGLKSLLLDLLVVRGDDQKFIEFVEKIIKKYV